MPGKPRILSLFTISFNKFINTGTLVQDLGDICIHFFSFGRKVGISSDIKAES